MLLSSRAWAAGAFFSLGASTYSTYQPHTAEERPHHLQQQSSNRKGAPTGKKKKRAPIEKEPQQQAYEQGKGLLLQQKVSRSNKLISKEKGRYSNRR